MAKIPAHTIPLQAPCSAHCLQGTDVRALLDIVAQVERRERPPDEAYEAAWRLVTEKNPFPAVCGRVCPHPCETYCNRREKDGAVAVNAIERFLGDWAIAHRLSHRKLTHGVCPERIAVIGSGPAGLSCAYHLARRGYSVTVFEAFPQPGGMLRYGIPAYRLPRHVLDAEIAMILDLGVNLRTSVAVGRDVSLDALRGQFDAVFIGIGAQRAARLGIPGEETSGVIGGVDFLRRVNSGESLEPGDHVVVVGGGNTAFDSARTARRLGAQTTLVYRRSIQEIPASAEEIAAAEEEGVEIIYLAAPVEILSQGGRLAQVICQRMRLAEPDASGRRQPTPIFGDTFVLEADSLITAVSQQVDWCGLESLAEVISGEANSNSDAAVQRGGDVTGLGLVAESLAEGRRAAERLHAQFRGLPQPIEDQPATPCVCPEQLFLEAVDIAVRHEPSKTPVPERLRQPWTEVTATLSAAQTDAEASRCVGCGESFIKSPRAHPIHRWRRATQIGIGAFLLNSYFAVFSTKTLYAGPVRNVCVPGLNCHSCPTSVAGCPIGMVQHFAATHRIPWFLIGFLGIIGLLSGRFTCGWLCPWGLVQDITHVFKKISLRIPRLLENMKYAMLVVVAIIIPYFTFEHWFSKLCPCGGLIAAIPWALWNPIDPTLDMPTVPDGAIGPMFWLKMWILGAFLIMFLFIKRPFCRTICPLGAIYALFNRISSVSVEVQDGCVDCGQCRAVCPVDLDPRRQVNAENCIKCLECTQCRHMRFAWLRFWRRKPAKKFGYRPVLQPAALSGD